MAERVSERRHRFGFRLCIGDVCSAVAERVSERRNRFGFPLCVRHVWIDDDFSVVSRAPLQDSLKRLRFIVLTSSSTE